MSATVHGYKCVQPRAATFTCPPLSDVLLTTSLTARKRNNRKRSEEHRHECLHPEPKLNNHLKLHFRLHRGRATS